MLTDAELGMELLAVHHCCKLCEKKIILKQGEGDLVQSFGVSVHGQWPVSQDNTSWWSV